MILQGAGGGVSSAALVNKSGVKIESIQLGAKVITAGLAFQVITLFTYMALCADFALRVLRRRRRLGDAVALTQESQMVQLRGSWRFKGFLGALMLATVLVFWRSCYRVAELNQGWTGPLTYNQNLFIGFEGVLMVIAISVLGIFHPALCMGDVMGGIKSDTEREKVRTREVGMLGSEDHTSTGVSATSREAE